MVLLDITEHHTVHFASRLCSGERRLVFERVIREIRPICEVEHIRKNLALKRVSREIIFNIYGIAAFSKCYVFLCG